MFVEHLDRLRTHLRPAGDLQRAFSQVWPQLSAPCRDELTRDAERYIRQPIPMWTACSMLKSGAQEYVQAYRLRRKMLSAFVLSACANDTARYDERIFDLAWAICEETAWANPPGRALVNDNPYDAQFAETAQLLAWTCCLAYKPIARVSDALDARIRQEITRRVCEPVIRNMELPTTDIAVLAPLTVAVLLSERDAPKRWGALRKLLLWLEESTGHLRAPAIGVWQRDAAQLMDALTIACFATGNEVDLRRMLRPLAEIPLYANLGGGYWLNPGERDMRDGVSGAALYRFGRGCGADALRALGAQICRLEVSRAGAANASITERMLSTLYEPDMAREAIRPGTPPSGRVRGAGFAVARSDVFCVAVHEGDPDGAHRDAGDCLLFYRNRPILCDLGAGFAETGQHNLPLIGLEGQRPGGKAAELEFEEQGDDLLISLDLSSAYPAQMEMESYQRTVVLSRRAREVRMVEVFSFARARQEVRFHFITPEKPVMQPQMAILGGVLLEWERSLIASAEPLGEGAWRILLSLPKPVRNGNATFTFRPVGN